MFSSVVLFGCVLSCLVQATAATTQCNVTRVNTYDFDCELNGVLGAPDPISKTYPNRPYTECAQFCLETKACRSFNVTYAGECTLFGKYLDQMEFTRENITGVVPPLYDRGCFSADCNVIRACRNSEALGFIYPDYENIYLQYACNYGKVAKSYGYSSRTVEIDGREDFDYAIYTCARQENYGSFDVHYVGQYYQGVWNCVLFDDDPKNRTSFRSQKISRRRYTVPVDGVGPGYGYLYDGNARYG